MRILKYLAAAFFITLFTGCSNSLISNMQQDFYNQYADMKYKDKDYAGAYNSYKESALKGNAYAYYKLYVMHIKGQGVAKDENMALQMLENSADLKYPAAQVILANRLIYTIKNRDVQKGIRLLKEAASKEYASAYSDLYMIYWYGIGVEKDLNEAGRYYRLAKANGIKIKIDSSVNAKIGYSADNKALTKQIQQALKDLRFYNGKVDGETGPLTRRAIKNFQSFYGYSINTEISRTLLNQIKNELR